MANVLVIGCGAWGTTLAQLVAFNKHNVSILCHEQKIIDDINNQHINSAYLPYPPYLSPRIFAYPLEKFDSLVLKSNYIIIAVASPFFRKYIEKIQSLATDQIIISATKGVEKKTNLTTYEIAAKVFDEEKYTNFTILSGPNLAEEIYLAKPAATVIASKNIETAEKVQQLISSDKFRAYKSTDILGVALGGILKNIIAIAAGMLDAKELGANAKAALLVRGIAEMRRYAIHQGASEETLSGLSGFGDLITTCTGPMSRNYSLGYRIGQGQKLNEILGDMLSVAEGVNSCYVIYNNSRTMHISMPITESICLVLNNEITLNDAISLLMTRELKEED